MSKYFRKIKTREINTIPEGATLDVRGIVNSDIGEIAEPSYSFIDAPDTGMYAQASIENWNTLTVFGTSLSAIGWAPEITRLLAINTSGGGSSLSTNGLDWVTAVSGWRAFGETLSWSPERTVFLQTQNRFYVYSDGEIPVTTGSVAGSLQYDRDIVWSSNDLKWVAVGPNGMVSTPDAVTWTTIISSPPLNGITYAPEQTLYVACGSIASGRIQYSSDATFGSWTTIGAIDSFGWNKIVWAPELTLYCVVGDSGSIATSPDAITWTTRESGISNDFIDIAWSPEITYFIAISSTTDIVSSRDAVTWTTQPVPSSVTNMNRIIWVPEFKRFFIPALSSELVRNDFGLGFALNSGEKILLQENLMNINANLDIEGRLGVDNGTWAMDLDDEKFQLREDGVSKLTLADRLRVGVGYLGTSGNVVEPGIAFQTNPDTGIYSKILSDTWNTLTVFGASISAIGWAPEITRLLAINTSGGGSSFSTNGNTWSTGPIGWRAFGETLSWAPERTVFLQTQIQFYRVSDGINTATGGTVPGSLQYDRDIVWSSNDLKWVAVGPNGMVSTPDASTWTTIFSTPPLNGIIYAPEQTLYVACGSSGSGRIRYSSDATFGSWTTIDAIDSFGWNKISWAPELTLYCVVGDTGSIASSSDAITWTTQVSGISNDFIDIAWSPDASLFVAISETTDILTSEDGATWFTQTVPAAVTNMNRIIWVPEFRRFFIPALSAEIVRSDTGIAYAVNGEENSVFSANETLLNNSLQVNGQFRAEYGDNALLFTEEDGFVVDIDGSPAELRITDNILISNARVRTSGGTRTEPSISFINDTGTGIFAKTTQDSWNTVFVAASFNASAVGWAPEITRLLVINNNTGGSSFSYNGLDYSTGPSGWRAFGETLSWSPERTVFLQTQIQFYRVSDGINTATGGTVPGSLQYDRDIVWSSNDLKWVAVGPNGMVSTPDAVTWTTIFSTPPLNGIIYAPEQTLYVACGSSGSGRIRYSSDATFGSWTTIDAIDSLSWNKIAWAPELTLYCVVGNSGRVATSSDAISWTTHDSGIANNFIDIAWGNSALFFTAISETTDILTSEDGVNWVTREVAPTVSLMMRVAWAPGLRRFIIAARDAQVLVTELGIGYSTSQVEQLAITPTSTTVEGDLRAQSDIQVSGTIRITKGTVTQGTSISTAVTLNGGAGVITTVSATTAAQSVDSFTVNNDQVLSDSSVIVTIESYSGTYATNGLPVVNVSNITSGSFDIVIINTHGSNALSGTLSISFLVI